MFIMCVFYIFAFVFVQRIWVWVTWKSTGNSIIIISTIIIIVMGLFWFFFSLFCVFTHHIHFSWCTFQVYQNAISEWELLNIIFFFFSVWSNNYVWLCFFVLYIDHYPDHSFFIAIGLSCTAVLICLDNWSASEGRLWINLYTIEPKKKEVGSSVADFFYDEFSDEFGF